MGAERPRYWIEHGWAEEDQVVDEVCKYLEREGYVIQERRKGREQGPDIIAIKDGKRLLVQAKGDREGHVTSSGTIYVDSMTLIGQVVASKGRGMADAYAIAIRPVHAGHIRQALPALGELGVRVLLVGRAGIEELNRPDRNEPTPP